MTASGFILLVLLFFLPALVLAVIWAIIDAKKAGKRQAELMMKQPPKPVALPDEDSTVKTWVGSRLTYANTVHGSVGITYTVSYDETAFEADSSFVYDNIKDVQAGMCGGDSATKTFTFTALKRGTYKITILHDFRGSIERTVTHNVIVK